MKKSGWSNKTKAMRKVGTKQLKDGVREISTNELDKVREKVYSFLNPFGYFARVEKSIGGVLYIIEPDTRKVGNKRSDFFDGMQILAMDNGTFEVSEYQAGENENELYIYKETNSLTNALKDYIKGNKRKPIKKYADGGEVGEINQVKIEIKPQYYDEKDNRKNVALKYDVNYLITFNNKDFIELTGTLKPYHTGRDYDYEFEVDYFADQKEEDYYEKNSEKIENEILDKFYSKKATGGGVKYIPYKDEEIMHEPSEDKYYANDEEFDTLKEAQNYIDRGSPMSAQTINAYRHGAFKDGGIVGEKWQIKDSNDKYFSVSMQTGNPVWNESPDLGYSYEKQEAEKIKDKLVELGTKDLKIVEYNPNWWKMKTGGRIDDISDKIQEGDIVWDERNKRYGVVLNTYDYQYGEIRLDSDGNQPIEYLHKLGSEGDKGTKVKLQNALIGYKSLRLKWPEYKYEKVNYADGGLIDINDFDMPVIRSQFEEEEFEFGQGGGIYSRTMKTLDGNITGKVQYNDFWKTYQVVIDGVVYEEFKNKEEAIENLKNAGFDKMALGGSVDNKLTKGDKVTDGRGNIGIIKEVQVNGSLYIQWISYSGEPTSDLTADNNPKDFEKMALGGGVEKANFGYLLIADKMKNLAPKSFDAVDEKFAERIKIGMYADGGGVGKSGLIKIPLLNMEDSDFQSLQQICESNDIAFYIDESEMYVLTDIEQIKKSNEKDVALDIIGKYDIEKMALGGSVEAENKEMVLNNNNQIAHHTKELQSALKGKNVPAWVVAKVNRSATDLSDATHYMEGQGESYADGGGTKSMFNSTKQKMQDRTQQERIDSLIEFVSQSNWSSKPITIKDNMVIVFSKMYDLEPIRVASIFNKYQGKSYADGGGVGENIVGEFYFDTRKDKAFRVISNDGTDISGRKRKDGTSDIGIQYYDNNKKPIGNIETINSNEFNYYVKTGAWNKWKQSYFKDGGGVSNEIAEIKAKIEKAKKNTIMPENLKKQYIEKYEKQLAGLILKQGTKEDVKDFLEVPKGKTPKIVKVEPKGKLKVKEILIHWAEGDNSKYDKFPKTYKTWEAANKAVIPVYEDYAKDDYGGYNKVKFTVTFEDGENYDGRLDVSTREDNPTKTHNVIGQHIKDYLDYQLSEKSRTSEANKKEIIEWLEKYDLGLEKSNQTVTKKATPKKETKSVEPSKGRTIRAVAQDKKRTAKKAGKRTAESGNTYYESRENRSDKSQKTRLENGGTTKGWKHRKNN